MNVEFSVFAKHVGDCVGDIFFLEWQNMRFVGVSGLELVVGFFALVPSILHELTVIFCLNVDKCSSHISVGWCGH